MAAMTRAQPLDFLKMHGLGNDFVVIDRRAQEVSITPELARAIGDRRRGIGFDQMVTIDSAPDVDARLGFWNADGSMSATCGNATRCIARHLMDESGATALALETERGRLEARDAGNGLTSVNLGPPILDWREIPLAREVDPDHLPIEGDPIATGMGNPHCTFFVDDAEAVEIETFGPRHEHDPLFPARTNVQVAHLAGPDRIRMRVWERGAGLTLASGSSSCAVAVAAHRRGLTRRDVQIDLDGGSLQVAWTDDGVWMTGPTMTVARGTLAPAFLDGAA